MLLSFIKVCKPTILFVDDNIYFSKLFSKILEKSYTVYTAANGLEALKIVHQGVRPELLVTDIHMPVMNGYELIKHLKESGIYNRVPICILTQYSAQEVKKELGNLLVEEIFTKPLDPQSLLNALERIFLASQLKFYNN